MKQFVKFYIRILLNVHKIACSQISVKFTLEWKIYLIKCKKYKFDIGINDFARFFKYFKILKRLFIFEIDVYFFF